MRDEGRGGMGREGRLLHVGDGSGIAVIVTLDGGCATLFSSLCKKRTDVVGASLVWVDGIDSSIEPYVQLLRCESRVGKTVGRNAERCMTCERGIRNGRIRLMTLSMA